MDVTHEDLLHIVAMDADVAAEAEGSIDDADLVWFEQSLAQFFELGWSNLSIKGLGAKLDDLEEALSFIELYALSQRFTIEINDYIVRLH